jgi:hypothetical protein
MIRDEAVTSFDAVMAAMPISWTPSTLWNLAAT